MFRLGFAWKVVLWVWTVLVIVGLVINVSNDLKDKIYTSNPSPQSSETLSLYIESDFISSAQRVLSISSASEITLKAGSGSPFSLLELGNEPVTVTVTEPPLGLERLYERYYTAGPIQIHNGQWQVEKGAATLLLTSESKITVTASLTEGGRFQTIVADWLHGVLIWVSGYAVVLVADVFAQIIRKQRASTGQRV